MFSRFGTHLLILITNRPTKIKVSALQNNYFAFTEAVVCKMYLSLLKVILEI